MFPWFSLESRLGDLRAPSSVGSWVTFAPNIRTEIAAFAVKTNLRLINQTSELRTWRRRATEDKRGRTDTQSRLTLSSSSSASSSSYSSHPTMTFVQVSSSLVNKTYKQRCLTFPALLSKTDCGHTSCKTLPHARLRCFKNRIALARSFLSPESTNPLMGKKSIDSLKQLNNAAVKHSASHYATSIMKFLPFGFLVYVHIMTGASLMLQICIPTRPAASVYPSVVPLTDG